MRAAKTEGFVLKKKHSLERDLLITLFTAEWGKITVMARGIKKITSRRLPHIQTGNLIDVIIQKRGNWYYLSETSLLSAFSQIKKSSSKVNYQYYLFFILDRLLPENEQEPEIYNLMKRFFIELSSSDNFNMNQIERYLNLILIKLGYMKEKKQFYQMSQIVEDLINEKVPLLI